jgi:hypothetical protein
MYGTWALLTLALRTGLPQSGPSAAGGFAGFYDEPQAKETFLRGMSGGSILVAQALAVNFPWKDYATVIDIGTAQGCVPAEIARAHAHLTGGGFDLPALAPAFAQYVASRGLGDRLKFHAGDFFRDPLPGADVLIMGRVLHDWDLATRMMLLRKAHDALPGGGALIVHDTLIDDARRQQSHSLLASLNMLIQTDGGSEYTGGECMGWMEEVGFVRTYLLPLAGFHTAVVGFKPAR